MKVKKLYRKKEASEKIGMSVKELAEVLGVGMNKAYDLVKREDFPKVNLGNKHVILRNRLEEWLENNIGEIL